MVRKGLIGCRNGLAGLPPDHVACAEPFSGVQVLSHRSKGLEPPVPTISMTAFRPGTVEQFVFTGCLVVSSVCPELSSTSWPLHLICKLTIAVP